MLNICLDGNGDDDLWCWWRQQKEEGVLDFLGNVGEVSADIFFPTLSHFSSISEYKEEGLESCDNLVNIHWWWRCWIDDLGMGHPRVDWEENLKGRIRSMGSRPCVGKPCPASNQRGSKDLNEEDFKVRYIQNSSLCAISWVHTEVKKASFKILH